MALLSPDRLFRSDLVRRILADPDLVTYGIIAAGLWPQIAYVMILYLTGLNNLRPDLIEALVQEARDLQVGLAAASTP